jgi:hypothetical protein
MQCSIGGIDDDDDDDVGDVISIEDDSDDGDCIPICYFQLSEHDKKL